MSQNEKGRPITSCKVWYRAFMCISYLHEREGEPSSRIKTCDAYINNTRTRNCTTGILHRQKKPALRPECCHPESARCMIHHSVSEHLVWSHPKRRPQHCHTRGDEECDHSKSKSPVPQMRPVCTWLAAPQVNNACPEDVRTW